MPINIYNIMIQQMLNYVSFTKPGISRAQLLTVSIGYFLAIQSIDVTLSFLYLLLATYFFSASACGANNILEVKLDALMGRTKDRELVVNKLSLFEARAIVVTTFLVGLFFVLQINLLTLLVSLATVVIYVGVYTPLKRYSWLNTHVGALPGALPLLGGWVATGTPIHTVVVAFFFTLFCWQIPHFYALSIMYFDDYKAAGFKMLPNQEGGVAATKRQIIVFSFLMVATSFVPFLMRFLSGVYAVGMLMISLIFLWGMTQSVRDLKNNAKKLFILSIIYLPLWFTFIIVDILLH